jgi:hypothetical protein
MTVKTNARLAGFTFLFYIAAGITSMVVHGRATAGVGIAAKLATIAAHAADLRLVALLTVLTTLSALTLGVTLYALTREQDRDLAMLALTCRIVEGVNGATSIPSLLRLLSLATLAGANATDTAAAHALGRVLLTGEGGSISAIFFAVGSTLFCWLLLRGRLIPTPLAWLGVAASVLLVIALPLQFARLLPASMNWFIWIPMLAFEVPFALWLLIRGVTVRANVQRT